MDVKKGDRSSRFGPSTQGQIDFLASLRLSLKVLKNAEPRSSVDELRRIIQARMAELKMEASLERKHAALEIACPVCGQPAGRPCVSLPSKTQFGKKRDPFFASHAGGQQAIMRWPHRQRIRAYRSSAEDS